MSMATEDSLMGLSAKIAEYWIGQLRKKDAELRKKELQLRKKELQLRKKEVQLRSPELLSKLSGESDQKYDDCKF